MSKLLTTKQQYWFDHITAAQQYGQSLSVYAAQHQLSLKALYRWRWRLAQLHNVSPQAVSTPRDFIQVLPPDLPSRQDQTPVVVLLRNGVRVQFAALTPAVLAMLQQC